MKKKNKIHEVKKMKNLIQEISKNYRQSICYSAGKFFVVLNQIRRVVRLDDFHCADCVLDQRS